MPRSKEQYDKIKSIRKDEIVKCALKLFALKGYEDVKIDDIAVKTKCSHGLFYHYYKTKEDLFLAAIDYANDLFISLFSNIDYKQKAKYALHDLITNFIEILKGKNEEAQLMLYLLMNLPLEKNIFPKIRKNLIKKKNISDIFYELIERGQKEGDFLQGNIKEYITAIISLFKGLTHTRILTNKNNLVLPDTRIVMNIVIKDKEE